MNKKKVLKAVKVGAIVIVTLIVLAVLTHLTANYLIPFIAQMHSKSGVY
ncbi:MAG TPA: hypothetical protein VHP38_10140 [Ruminiclostridium sp.]|nr:hypothetical protein [Ruminiclostridium sp.]